MRQLAFSLAPAPAQTLQSFVAGRNRELLSALIAAASGGPGERFIYLWGERSCGKSHLLAGVAAAVGAAGGVSLIARTDAELRAVDPQARADMVLIDDVHSLSETAQSNAFTLYNAMRERGGGFIAAGDMPPPRLALREDLVTRLGWGLVYQVHALSDEEKAAALEAHARMRGFSLPREVVDYLLIPEARNLNHLLGVLDALDRFSLETKRPVTVPLARELLVAIADER